MRRRAPAATHLQTYDDPYLSPRLRALTPDELLVDWYAVRILAPARYRAALWEAVGQLGDHHFYDVAKVQGATAAAVWSDS